MVLMFNFNIYPLVLSQMAANDIRKINNEINLSPYNITSLLEIFKKELTCICTLPPK